MRKSTYRILTGDAIEQLKTLPDRSVQCVVTSPPYYALRDYGVPGQIGLEDTPQEYVARLVEVFREVRRVLRDDGTVFLNLGDSYAANRSYQVCDNKHVDVGNNHGSSVPPGLKPKDMMGIPWRVAFALQDDGWWLRSDIIWHKPNPMPESVTDRPTKAHEYVFLLTKASRYYYDAEAVKEEAIYAEHHNRYHSKSAGRTENNKNADNLAGNNGGLRGLMNYSDGRNRRSVWTIATQPYSGAHFAVMPPTLVEPCIKAGTSERGCCLRCGAPWRRVAEKETRAGTGAYDAVAEAAVIGTKIPGTRMRGNAGKNLGPLHSSTLGWQPTCACDAGEPVPCTVLDPFGGSGTTAGVAIELGRSAVICELNPAYVSLAVDRIETVISWIKAGKPSKKPKKIKVNENDKDQPSLLDGLFDQEI